MNNLTPEQLEKSRKEFEEHFKTFGVRFDRDHRGCYEAGYVQDLWTGWQARHKTISVELPDAWDSTYVDDVMDAAKVRASLDAAGVNHD